MYSRSFKYLNSDFMFLFTHTHVQIDTSGRAGGSRSETVFDYIHFLPSAGVHVFASWVLQVFQCGVAQSLIKMAESRAPV